MVRAFRVLNAYRSSIRGDHPVLMDTMRRIVLAGLAGAALATTPAAAADAPPTSTAPTTTPTPTPKAHYTTLSNRPTCTRWAYTNLTLNAKSEPGGKGRNVGKLHFNTEDGPPE